MTSYESDFAPLRRTITAIFWMSVPEYFSDIGIKSTMEVAMKKVKANRVMGKKWIHRLFVLCYFCLVLRVCGTVYYVTSGGDDQQDALSWGTAAVSIQSAMDRASPGDQVWVASGMYHPSEKRETPGSGLIFMYSFQLRDGVSLFGGFAGTEQAPEERQRLDQDGNGVLEAWEFASETILAGQPDFPGQVIYGGLQAFTVPLRIDGFSICAGDACGKGWDGEGGGALLPGNCILQGCQVFRNKARRGGGVALIGAALVRQCLLQNNELYLQGWAGEGAGAFLAGEGAGLENTLVIDNGVENSGAYLGGGGVAVLGAGSVDFCTIVGNFSTGEGSGIRYVGEGGTLRNSVIWGNLGHSCQLSTEETQIHNCAVESCQVMPGCIRLNSANCGESGVAVNENLLHCYFPCFNAPECSDFRLSGGSYLLNRAMESPGADAANQPRTQNQYADIGCFESALPGNLTADFQLAMPLLYAESSPVNYRLGTETPDAIEACFSAIGGTVQKLNSGSDEWQLTCTQNGVVEIILQLQRSTEIAAFWNPFVFSRSLPVLPKSLLLKAADLTWQWASETPLLTWQLLYGELSGEDAIIGSLQTVIPNGLGDYPIEQGTLRVSDSAEGMNYALQFLPGVLTCVKGNTEIQFSDMEKSYTANPIVITVQTQPPDLAVSLTYQGVEETLYPESATPPVNAGKYCVTARVNEELYEGVASAILQVHKASLICQAEDQEREYLRDNPSPLIRYVGFLGQDSEADIIPPMAFVAADHFSPVTEAGYEIILQGGSAENYQLELRNGRLWIREMQPLTNEALLSVGVYGMPLKQILIMAYAISPIDGSYLPGNFVWDQEDQVLGAGLWQCAWHFVPDEQNYQGIAGQSLVTIEQREVRVAALPKAKQYGDPDPVLEYQVTAGSLVAGDFFSGGLLRVPGENVGSYVIRQGSLALQSNYELIFTEENFSIHPRRIQLLAEDVSKYEGQPDPILLWHCVDEEPVNGDAFSGTLQREEGEEAGQYSILQGNLRISDNYLIDYQPGTLAILPPVYRLSGDLLVARLVYGQALIGDMLQGNVEMAATGEVVPGHFCWDEEGSYPESGALLAAWSFIPDLDIGFPELNGSLELQVEKAVLQVSIQGSPNRKYGEENPLFELQYEGFVLAEDTGVLLQQPEITCTAEQNSLPGNYEILMGAGLADNYELLYNPAFLRIEAWLIQVQALNQQKEFAQPDPEWTFVYQGNLLENDGFSGQLQRQTGERPGQYLICQGSLSLPPWYQLDFQAGSLSIGPAPLTVTADDQSIYYGDNLPILTYQINSGALLEGDSMSGGLSCEWEKQPGTYTISRGNLTAGAQYQITFLPGILEVLPCPLTVQAVNQEKFYSLTDPNQPLAWQITEGRLISPDTISGMLEREPGEEPGEYRICQGSMAVSPANYYQLNFLEGVFLIKKIVPNGLAFPLDVIYHGGTVMELSYQSHFYDRYTSVELSGTCYWPTAEERLRRGTASRNLVFRPDDSEHYTEATTSLLVQIRIRALDLNAENKLMVYGDSVPDLTWNIGGFELFPEEEITGELELVEVETGLSPDFNSPLPVGEYRILQGSMLPPSDDYRFLFHEGRLSVNKRVIVIQAVDTSIIAGNADPELEFVICEGTLVDGDQFSGSLTRASGTLPGNYPIQLGTLALNENYELQFMEGIFTILAAGSTRSSTKEYGTSSLQISASDGQTPTLENQKLPDATFDPGESLVLTGEEELAEEELAEEELAEEELAEEEPETLRIQA
ncbi:MAG: MBG domain-containing protein, partial [Lentisphaeria bacterium]